MEPNDSTPSAPSTEMERPPDMPVGCDIVPTPQEARYTFTLVRVRNGWLLHGGQGDYVVRVGAELLEALREDVGLDLDGAGIPAKPEGNGNGTVPTVAAGPVEPPTRLKAKAQVSTVSKTKVTEFVHPTCGHKSNLTAGGCMACHKRFCSVCFRCGCAA